MENHEAKSTAPSPPSRLGRWWNVLWIGPRVAEARALRFEASQPGFVWWNLARRITADLDNLGELSRTSWSTLLLQCTAFGFLVRAHLARADQGHHEGPLLASDWESLPQFPPLAAAWNGLTVAQTASLIAWLGPEQNPTPLAGLPERDREALFLTLRRLSAGLARPLEVEANRLRRALLARWIRLGVAAVGFGIPLWLAGSWIGTKLQGRNLALNSRVTISSQYVFEGTNHALLVDGDRNNLGFCTDNQGQQWVVIDLGESRRFSKVVVYNRADCCQARAVPLKLEVSDDNLHYSLLAERTEPFRTWTTKGLQAKGRFIRLKNAPNTFLHLAEVEVY